MTPAEKAIAARMQSDGKTLAEIGRFLRVHESAVYWSLNPEQADSDKQEKLARQREYQNTRWAADFEFRCRRLLSQSQQRAKKFGYPACNATVEPLLKRLTGSLAFAKYPKRNAVSG